MCRRKGARTFQETCLTSALIERLISVVKRQRSGRAPGRALRTQCLQALLLGIAYAIYHLWLRMLTELVRMSTEPRHLLSRQNNDRSIQDQPKPIAEVTSHVIVQQCFAEFSKQWLMADKEQRAAILS